MATTTPNYGWPVPTSTDYVKDGATAIEALGDAIDATVFGLGSGMKLVKSQVIGSAVSSVTVTGAFSTTYENYKIIISGGVASVETSLRIQMGSAASGHYGGFVYTTATGGSLTSTGDNNTTRWNYCGGTNANGNNAVIELLAPFLSQNTYITAFPKYTNGYGTFNGVQIDSTSFTAFTLSPNSGTLTGGTIYVYGYQK